MALQDPELRAVLADLPADWKKPYATYQGVLRASSVSGAPGCPRAYLFANRLRWGFKEDRASDALVIGSLVHRLLAGLYSGLTPAGTLDAMLDAVTPIIEAQTDSKKQSAMVKSWNVARVLVDHWLTCFGAPAEWGIEVLAVEQTISATLKQLYTSAPMLCGTLDVAFCDNKTGEVWIEDHKTCSEAPALRAQGLTFDTQARCYRYLWNNAHPRTPAVGFVHNILMKPSIRLKKNQTYEEYYKEVDEWFATTLAGEPGKVPLLRSRVRFHELPLLTNPESGRLVQDAALWANYEPSLATFYRNRKRCVQYQKVCPYMDLCESDCKMWPSILCAGVQETADSAIKTSQIGKYRRLEPPMEAAMKGHGDLTADIQQDFTG